MTWLAMTRTTMLLSPPSCSNFCGGDQFFFELRVTVLIMTFLSRLSVNTTHAHTHTHFTIFDFVFETF